MTPQEFRVNCRSESFTSHTSGICPGYAQANLIVVPKRLATDFENLCLRNPVPCPLLAKTINETTLDKPIINHDFNITTDIPKYTIYRHGNLIGEKLNIKQEWSQDYVGFLLGCSFSFENALIQNGLTPRNVITGTNVSMYTTTKLLDNSGVFVHCPYVVSMRPYRPKDVEKIRQITGEFLKTHGEPIDWGFDGMERLGIKDLSKPDFGDPVDIEDDEIPVFWGCGVTPQAAVLSVGAKYDEIFMGHAPGHMLVLDITEQETKRLF